VFGRSLCHRDAAYGHHPLQAAGHGQKEVSPHLVRVHSQAAQAKGPLCANSPSNAAAQEEITQGQVSRGSVCPGKTGTPSYGTLHLDEAHEVSAIQDAQLLCGRPQSAHVPSTLPKMWQPS